MLVVNTFVLLINARNMEHIKKRLIEGTLYFQSTILEWN